MSSMKTIYVVRGSEDGTLGVFSNVKLAFARLQSYLVDSTDSGAPITDSGKSIDKPARYAHACAGIAHMGYYSARSYDFSRVRCEIERHFLNQQ